MVTSPPVPVQLPSHLTRSSVNKLQLPSITSLPAHAQFLCSHNLCSYSFLCPPHLMFCISSPVNSYTPSPIVTQSCQSPVVTLSYLCHTICHITHCLSTVVTPLQVVTPSTHVVTSSPMFISMVTPSHFGCTIACAWSHLPPSHIVMPSPAYLQ